MEYEADHSQAMPDGARLRKCNVDISVISLAVGYLYVVPVLAYYYSCEFYLQNSYLEAVQGRFSMLDCCADYQSSFVEVVGLVGVVSQPAQ